jgi:CDP-diacylglycerol---serine O-phosphatidyltransferase
MIKNLPNFITSINLLLGCLGLFLLFTGEVVAAAMCIWAAALADFLDGFVARAVNANSLMGKELDSLADVVSFGVLPAFIWFYYIAESIEPGLAFAAIPAHTYLPFVALLMAACSAWRLAKFNIDDRQTDHFRGVPTPANALVWSAIPFVSSQSLFPWPYEGLNNTIFVLVFGTLLSWLLVSDFPLLAFKFKVWSFGANKIKYMFLALSLVLFLLLGANAVFLVFLSYLGASFLEYRKYGA